MNKYNAEVSVRLKTEVLDPQGQAIQNAFEALGVKNVEDVRQGKIFDLVISAETKNEAEKFAHQCCKKLLVNEVVEEAVVAIKEKKNQ